MIIIDEVDINDKKVRKRAYRAANADKIKANNKAYRAANADKIKAYRGDNVDKIKDRMQAYRAANVDKIKATKKVYRGDNADKIKANNKAYRAANVNKAKAYQNNRLKTDIQYKLSKSLRSRLNKALQGNYKTGSAVKDLGCSIVELQMYLESKFQSGMTWDNHGLFGWHIDHIKPLASFDLTNRAQLLIACHYTNLQPLWAIDNLAKGDSCINV